MKANIGYRYLFLSLFISLTAFLYRYWSDPGRPGIFPDGSWYTSWYDQGQYYQIAKGLAYQNLEPGHLAYPIGYPLLAVPFFFLFPKDPFLIPNIILFLGTILTFYLIISHIVRPKIAFFTIFLLVSGTREIIDFTTPWTANFTAFSYSVILYLCLFHSSKFRTLIFSSIITGYTFLCRPIDAIFLIPFLIYLLLVQKTILQKFIALIPLTFVNLIFIALFFLTNNYYNRSQFGSYFNAIGQAGVYPYGIFERLFGYFINSYVIQKETHFVGGAMLQYSFFYLFLPLGFLYLLNLKNKTTRIFLILVSLSFTLWIIFYFSLNIPIPQGLKYQALHLTTVWHPLFSFFSLIGLYSLFNTQYIFKHLRSISFYMLLVITFPILAKLISARNLTPAGWTITASEQNQNSYKIIDSDPLSSWDGGPQKKGKNITINFNKVITISRLYIESRVNPIGFPQSQPIIEGSLDNSSWYDLSLDKTMPRDPPSSFINFPTMLTPAKYLRITLSENHENLSWSISNLIVNGYNYKIFYLPSPPYVGKSLLYWLTFKK